MILQLPISQFNFLPSSKPSLLVKMKKKKKSLLSPAHIQKSEYELEPVVCNYRYTSLKVAQKHIVSFYKSSIISLNSCAQQYCSVKKANPA